jgi:hypothetical protein
MSIFQICTGSLNYFNYEEDSLYALANRKLEDYEVAVGMDLLMNFSAYSKEYDHIKKDEQLSNDAKIIYITNSNRYLGNVPTNCKRIFIHNCSKIAISMPQYAVEVEASSETDAETEAIVEAIGEPNLEILDLPKNGFTSKTISLLYYMYNNEIHIPHSGDILMMVSIYVKREDYVDPEIFLIIGGHKIKTNYFIEDIKDQPIKLILDINPISLLSLQYNEVIVAINNLQVYKATGDYLYLTPSDRRLVYTNSNIVDANNFTMGSGICENTSFNVKKYKKHQYLFLGLWIIRPNK